MNGKTTLLNKGDATMNVPKIEKIKGLSAAAAALLLAVGLLLSPLVAKAEDLLHNSAGTGSTKWQSQGGWGVANGKYGAFTCDTCHEPKNRQNIKNIRRVISTPNGENWPNGSPDVAVSFRNVTSMGSDARKHNSSNRICEVCHSANQYHNYSSGNNTGGLGHPTPNDVCTTCHSHSTGFKAACGGCHGNPPTHATFGNNSGLIGRPRPSNALLPGEAGAHATHKARSMVCDTCHYINNGTLRMPSQDGTIQIGFFGFGGKVTSGTYVPYTSAGRGYPFSSGTAGTAIAAGATDPLQANVCRNVYCHGGGAPGKAPLTGGSNQTPRWDATGQNQCGACHGTTADNGPTTAGHPKHASTAGYGFNCDLCHPVSGDNSHVQGNVRWKFNPSDQRTAGATYQAAGASTALNEGSTGNLAPSDQFGQCGNLYCHSNGRSGADLVTKAPNWGDPASVNGCTGCHDGNAASASPIYSRGHKTHVNNSSSQFGGFDFKCYECHNTVADSTDSAVVSTSLHVNGRADVSWGPRSAGGGDYATYGCTQIYCHSNGQPGGFKSPPMAWNDIPDNEEGMVSCDYCHGGLISNATPIASNRHTNHINGSPIPHRPATCNDCHSQTVAASGTAIYNGPDSKHINRTIDVTFLKLGNFSGVWTKSATNCSGTWCHGVRVQNWTTTTVNTCGSCHAANNRAAFGLSSSHIKHYNSSTAPSSTTVEGWTNVNNSRSANVFMCGTCHPDNPAENHINGPAAANGSAAQVLLRLPFSIPAGAERPEVVTRGTSPLRPDASGYIYSSGTTCDTYCHSDARGGPPKNVMRWARTTTSCGNCHNKASDDPNAATTTWSKPHNKHANTYGNGGTIGANNTTTNNTLVTCAACHYSTASSNTALRSNQRAKHPNGFRNVSASSTVGSAAFRWNPGSNSCKNGYCHSRAYSFTDYSTPWIKWDQSQDVHCGSCHSSYPVGPDYPNGYKGKANSHPKHAVFWGFTCDWCHNATTTTGNTITNVRNHVNKNYNVVANGTKAFIGRANSFTATATTNPPSVKTTCTNVNCHGGGSSNTYTWGGTNKCSDCHLSTAADLVDYTFSKTPTQIVNINSAEWSYSGHGKTTGSYDVSGNPAANFPGAVATAGDQCLFCHDYSISHGDAANPLRLRNFNSGVQTWGKNSVCLVCHASVGSTGVDPDGAGTAYTSKTATRKVNKYHYGLKHSDSLNGGRFCWDCHDSHGDRTSTNSGPIAMVHLRPAMATYSSTGVPSQFTASNVSFIARTNGSDFAKTAAPFNGVCNVCHTYKASDPNKLVHYTATSYDGSHSTANCTTSCHPHNADTTADGRAYAVSANGPCDACHGGNNNGNLSAGATAGHAVHYNQATVFNNYSGSNKHSATAYGFACKNCHPKTLTSHSEGDGRADLQPVGGTYTFGATDITDAKGFVYSSGGSCGTNNCHQDGNGGTPKAGTFVWSGARTGNCGICHNRAGDSGVAAATWSGGHVKHATVYQGNTNLTCNSCHSSTAANNSSIASGGFSTHLNGTKTVVINIAFGTGNQYNGSCAGVRCHSDGKTTPSYVAVNWSADVNQVTCTTCHGGNGTSNKNGVALSSSHARHFPYASLCAACHAKTADPAGNMALKNYTGILYHVNMARNVVMNSSYGGSWSGTQCQNVYCHSDGKGTTVTTPAWSTGATLNCGGCHGGGAASGMPNTGAHAKHMTTAANGGGIGCYMCHNSTITATGTISSPADHINRSSTPVGGGAWNSIGVSFQPNTPGAGQCSTVSCHGNGTSPAAWGTPLDCEGCHPSATLSAGHAVHIGDLLSAKTVRMYNYTANKSTGSETGTWSGANSYRFGCTNCHPKGLASHMNGVVEVDLQADATGESGSLKRLNPSAPTPAINGSKQCLNIYCHSNGYATGLVFATTPSWGSSFASAGGDKCAKCHDNAPGRSGGIAGSGAHDKHSVAIHYTNIFNGVDGKLPSGGSRSIDAAHGAGNRATTISCNICHYSTVNLPANDRNPRCSDMVNGCHTNGAPAMGEARITNRASHVNGRPDVIFAPSAIAGKAQVRPGSFVRYTAATNGGWTRNNNRYKNFTSAYDLSRTAFSAAPPYSGGTCANIVCHNGSSATWTQTITCQDCHTKL